LLPTWRSCRSCCNPLVRIASQPPSRRSGSYTTVAGDTIKSVQIGWEAAGTLNADKSNAIVVTHFFSPRATHSANTDLRTKQPAIGTP
jgi:homoserine acetyltransferase